MFLVTRVALTDRLLGIAGGESQKLAKFPPLLGPEVFLQRSLGARKLGDLLRREEGLVIVQEEVLYWCAGFGWWCWFVFGGNETSLATGKSNSVFLVIKML